ncbi:unnamed protein product [Adineta ricciae]|uniref:Uncharacterized protein n=1 Tax=Adineta ricciae TaxID=249248 RepID=A0A814UA58_ADIRI|nr:unnamed protein product [Adineta ricciae]
MMINNQIYYYPERIDENSDEINVNMSFTDQQHLSTDICSTQSINIDTLSNGSIFDPHTHNNNTSMAINKNNTNYFKSSWQQQTLSSDDEDDDHSIVLYKIQIIFTIPYPVTNNSILNKTIFIRDVKYNELLGILTDICVNASSFILNYSTIKPLPHNICLHLLLNLTSTTPFREIIFCRTIEDLSNTESSSNDTESESHSVGPSGYFILSQCVIIFIMMMTIYIVQTARKKSLVNRVGQHLIHSRPYITVFGARTNEESANNRNNTSTESATTLQAGLNQVPTRLQLASVANVKLNAPIDEQVLAANDLTSTMYDRRASRVYINRDLIDVKEFTKRLSVPCETSTDSQSHVSNDD